MDTKDMSFHETFNHWCKLYIKKFDEPLPINLHMILKSPKDPKELVDAIKKAIETNTPFKHTEGAY